MNTPQVSAFEGDPEKVAFVASGTPEAQSVREELERVYGGVAIEDADCIVALGGDGFLLQTLHRYMWLNKPVFGMKLGTIGFLMNLYREEGLLERIVNAQVAVLRPLEMQARTESGQSLGGLAINEVSLLRQTKQAARIRVSVDDVVKLEELVCDGILLATSAGSTAYNLSAHGPILPLGCEVLAMTPISPFRPRRWRGALLRSHHRVRFEVLDHYKRPVSATADAHEVRDVVEVDIIESPERRICVMFDPEHNLEERILNEQFAE